MLDESKRIPKDKIFIIYLNYIFTRGFTKKLIILPVRKREKEKFQYLNNLLDILSKIFKEKNNERDKLYQTEKSKFSVEFKNKL